MNYIGAISSSRKGDCSNVIYEGGNAREDGSDIVDQGRFGLANGIAARVKLRHIEVAMCRSP
jgi:hypothetical protein